MKTVRALLAFGLAKLAYLVAPTLHHERDASVIERIRPYVETMERGRRVRVVRPGGLTTTHGPRARWGG